MYLLVRTRKGKKPSKVICLGILSMFILLPFWNSVSGTYLEGGNQLGVKNTKVVWEEMERVSELGAGVSEDPAMVMDSQGNIHVIWVEYIDFKGEILYKRFSVVTAKWSEIQYISNQSANCYSQFPSIEIDEMDGIHVIWQELKEGYDLLYRYCIGNEWSEIQTIVNRNILGPSHALTILEGNKAFLVWADEHNDTRELYYKYQISDTEWSANSTITTNFTRPYYPALTTDYQKGIHLVWTGYNATKESRDILYQTFNGSCWDTENQLVISTIDSFRASKPDIGIDSKNNRYFVWENEYDDPFDRIQFRAMINGLIGNIVNITNSGSAGRPKICVDGNNNVHLVWDQDLRIYCKTLFEQAIWSETSEATTQESIVYDPLIGCNSNNNVHVIWNDYSIDKSWEIYYRKGTITEKRRVLIIIAIVIPSALVLVSLLFFIVKKKSKAVKNENIF